MSRMSSTAQPASSARILTSSGAWRVEKVPACTCKCERVSGANVGVRVCVCVWKGASERGETGDRGRQVVTESNLGTKEVRDGGRGRLEGGGDLSHQMPCWNPSCSAPR